MEKTVLISAMDAIEEVGGPKQVVYRAFHEGRIRGHQDQNGRIFFERESFNEWKTALKMKRKLWTLYRANRNRPQVATAEAMHA